MRILILKGDPSNLAAHKVSFTSQGPLILSFEIELPVKRAIMQMWFLL